MANASLREIECDHLESASEHTLWLGDVGRWRSEHRRLVDQLAKAQKAVLEQDEALDGHAREIQRHEMLRLVHELSMGNPGVKEDLSKIHEELEAGHARRREAHARMAKHHERVRKLVDQLWEGLNGPM